MAFTFSEHQTTTIKASTKSATSIEAHENLSNWKFESPSGFRTTFPKNATNYYASSREQMVTTFWKNQRLCSEHQSIVAIKSLHFAKNPAFKVHKAFGGWSVAEPMADIETTMMVLANPEVADNALHRFASDWYEEMAEQGD